MKIVVTVQQCRRVVLPYLMVKHVLPRMRERVAGSVELVLIQHRSDATGENTRLATNRQGAEGLERVARWTEEGRYDGADVVTHSIDHPPYPSIPGVHLCLQEALDRGADFHLWLEDDALVWDEQCHRWDELLGRTEVGVYRRFHDLNSAFLVTRPSFDERFLPRVADYTHWGADQRLETEMRRNMRTRRTYLEPRYAVRDHKNYYAYTGLEYVVERVRELCPDDAHLLDIDFGEGTHALPPLTAEERDRHRRADRAKLKNRLRQARQRLTERLFLPG